MELLAFLSKHKDLLATIGLAVGGGFALWRWLVDQRWRRVQFAYGLTEKFFADENTKLALRMLDATGEMNLPADEKDGKPRAVHISEKLLINSLLTLEQQKTFAEPEFSIRMIFDEFFTGLSAFQHHIEAGLVKLEDIQPYLKYWVGSINGHGSIYSIALARQINAFLKAFGYTAVLKLSESMQLGLKDVQVTLEPSLNRPDHGGLVAHYRAESLSWKHELNTTPTEPRVTIGYRVHSQIAQYLSILRTDNAYARNDSRKNADFKTLIWDVSEEKPASILVFFKEEDEARSALQEALEKQIVPSLEEQRKQRLKSLDLEEEKEDETGETDEDPYWGIKQGVFKVGALALETSSDAGRSSGLIFRYPPGAFGSHKEGPYEVFVRWKTFEAFLSPEGVKIFGGARPKGNADR